MGVLTVSFVGWEFLSARIRPRIARKNQEKIYAHAMPLNVTCWDAENKTEINPDRYEGDAVVLQVKADTAGFVVSFSLNSGGSYTPISQILEISPDKVLEIRRPFTPPPTRASEIGSGGRNRIAMLGVLNRSVLENFINAHEWTGVPLEVLERAGAVFPFSER